MALDDSTKQYHNSDDGSSEAAIDLSDDEILKFLEIVFRNVGGLVKNVLISKPDSCRVKKLVKVIEGFEYTTVYTTDNNLKHDIHNLLKVITKYFI
jgi:hypothetical protein